MTRSTLAAAAAAAAGDDAPENQAAPEAEAPAETEAPRADPPAPEPEVRTLGAAVIGMDAATAFAMTALAFPARADLYNALGAAAKTGDAAAFQAALVTARDGAKSPAISTAQSDPSVSKTGGAQPKIDHAEAYKGF